MIPQAALLILAWFVKCLGASWSRLASAEVIRMTWFYSKYFPSVTQPAWACCPSDGRGASEKAETMRLPEAQAQDWHNVLSAFWSPKPATRPVQFGRMG